MNRRCQQASILCLCVLALAAAPPALADDSDIARLQALMKRLEEAHPDYTHPESSAIVKAVLTDWMTNPKVKAEPYHYLIDPDDKGPKPKLERLLIEQRSVPKAFQLEIPDVKVELFDRSKQKLKKGEMCIRVDRFELKKNGEVEIDFVHSGYGIIGGAIVTYRATKVDDKWTATIVHSFDP